MAQNVTIAGASYPDVPSIEVPKTGGGTAQFFDTTSVTAAAADVASGKYFMTAAGVLTEGALDLANYALVADELIKVSMGSQTGTGSSVTWSKSNAKITADHEMLAYALGTPAAQVGNLTWTTSSGGVTVSGNVNGTTTLTLILGKIGTTVN